MNSRGYFSDRAVASGSVSRFSEARRFYAERARGGGVEEEEGTPSNDGTRRTPAGPFFGRFENKKTRCEERMVEIKARREMRRRGGGLRGRLLSSSSLFAYARCEDRPTPPISCAGWGNPVCQTARQWGENFSGCPCFRKNHPAFTLKENA